MYDSESLKVLCGNSIEIPEMEYDDEMAESETGFPVQEEAAREFDFTTITDNMNHPDFMENYLEAMRQIRTYSTEHQQLLSNAIIQKMPEKYDFEFSINYDFDTQEQINDLYQFIEFYEYKHENFIVTIWKFLNPDTNSFQIGKFCEHNIPNIMKEVEEQLETKYYPELIADFLRTYNKEKFIEWFCEKSENLRASILYELRKE